MILVAALMLGACVGGRQATGVFRDAGVPIWSAAAFAPDQILGDWRQVAGFATKPGGCTTGGLSFSPAPGGLTVQGSLCLDGRQQRIKTVARPSGPGRLTLKGQEDWWILWVDSGYRTLVIGTPSGRFGFVLDRGAIPQDRLQAADEIFDFNGYAVGGLRPL